MCSANFKSPRSFNNCGAWQSKLGISDLLDQNLTWFLFFWYTIIYSQIFFPFFIPVELHITSHLAINYHDIVKLQTKTAVRTHGFLSKYSRCSNLAQDAEGEPWDSLCRFQSRSLCSTLGFKGNSITLARKHEQQWTKNEKERKLWRTKAKR